MRTADRCEPICRVDPGFQATRAFDQSPTVVQVEPSSAADRGGLKAGDVILEINEQQAGRDFERKIAGLGPGAVLRVTISRSGLQQDLQWNLSAGKQKVFRLQDVPEITDKQKSRRASWLFGNTTIPASLPK